jgi:hypothetical protein
MAVTFANIIVGEGTLSVSNNVAGATFYDVGATQEGVVISWEPDMVDIEVDQFGDAARVIQSKVKVSIKTTMAENTFSNLALAWGYGGITAYGDSNVTDTTKPGVINGSTTATLNLGIHSALPEERKLKVVGPAPGTTTAVPRTRTYLCTRAISMASSEISYKRNENIKLPVSFRILPDPQFTGKEYGTIADA